MENTILQSATNQLLCNSEKGESILPSVDKARLTQEDWGQAGDGMASKSSQQNSAWVSKPWTKEDIAEYRRAELDTEGRCFPGDKGPESYSLPYLDWGGVNPLVGLR